MRLIGKFSLLRRPAVLLVILVLASLFVLAYIAASDRTDYHPWYLSQAPCHTPREVREDMIELVLRLHKVLSNLKIRHIVCYGTLWGVLRNEDILEWDNNVDMCAVNEDIYNHNEVWLDRMFKKYGIRGVYNTWEGTYDVRYGKATGKVTLFQSEPGEMMGRVGMERRVKAAVYARYHQFPSWMLRIPLNVGKLGAFELPIPHGEVDIQKHLYPDDWWKEVKPKGCK